MRQHKSFLLELSLQRKWFVEPKS